MKAASVLAAASLAAIACGNEPVAPGDVLALAVCDPAKDAECRPVADGRSLVTVTACAPSGNRVSPLDVTLRLSSSAWSSPTDPTDRRKFTASLATERCVAPAFVADTQPGPVRVDADLLGFRATAFVVLAPAPLQSLTIVPAPATLVAGQVNTVTLTPAASATNGGAPSKGTRVSWAVTEVVPASGVAFVLPAELDLESTNPIQLHTDSTVTRVSVRATAVPPVTDGAPAAASASATLTISVLP